MQNPLSRRFNVAGVSLALFLFISPAALSAPHSSAARSNGSSSSAAPPCPTCAQVIGLDAFQASVQGEIIPVIVELQELPGVMTRMAAERAGQVMGFKELTAHSAELHAKQRAFIATLPRRGV